MPTQVQIRTTHTGSLPRPADLTDMLVRRDHGEQVAGLNERVAAAVVEVVGQQRDAGITVVNDGEMSKINYSTYVTGRLEGFGGASDEHSMRPVGSDEFPEFFRRRKRPDLARPACIAAVRHRGLDGARTDIANMTAALAATDATDAFMTAASPGIISRYLENQYYESHNEYIWALAEAMTPEYEAIHAAGFRLQLDCPDLTGADGPEMVSTHIEAINHATRNIPADAMRLHLCWGNYEGPHNHDVPLRDLISLVLKARPAGLSFEGANPRHEHEWRVFEEVELPEGKVLIPGVIDSTTNYIEHPQLVADRILRYARIVGPERVIAGTDCGFATVANSPTVDPAIAWAKLATLGEGAELAGSELSHAVGR